MTRTELLAVVDDRPMTYFQVTVVALCCLINMLDGFDILAIAFTGARIAAEMQFDARVQGFIYAAGPLGMALGAFVISPLADIIGRRRQIILSVSVISFGMIATFFVRNPTELFILRLLTGIGIGSMLASLNTVVAEFSNRRRRNLSLSVMHLGYGIGAGFGGILTVYLLAAFSGLDVAAWRYVFLVGGAMTLLTLPFILFLLPESMEFVVSKRPANALQQVNRLLARLGHAPIDRLPEATAPARKTGSGLVEFRNNVAALFADRRLAVSSTSLYVITFFYSVTLYFMLSWTTQVLLDFGLAESNAIFASSLLTVFGALGGVTLGHFSDSLGLRRLSIFFVSAGAASLTVFGTAEVWAPAIGIGSGSMTALLLLLATVTGFLVVGFLTGYLATGARVYPAKIRSTGLGVAVGVGRIGAAVGPAAAGLMLAANWSRPTLFVIFSLPLVICLIAYMQIRGYDGE